MKNILFFLLFSTIGFSQNNFINTAEILWDKIDSDLYIKLIDSVNDNYDVAKNDKNLQELIKIESLKSLTYSNQLIFEFPDSGLVFDALYKKAIITYDYLESDSAHEILLKVVNFKTERTDLKRRALRVLASIEIDKQNYEQAIFYLDESSNYLQHFTCGTALRSDKEGLKNLYTTCFNGLKAKKQ